MPLHHTILADVTSHGRELRRREIVSSPVRSPTPSESRMLARSQRGALHQESPVRAPPDADLKTSSTKMLEEISQIVHAVA